VTQQLRFRTTMQELGLVVAAGVETQVYAHLSFEQRKALIRRTIEFIDGRAPVLASLLPATAPA